jgi:carbamate kinase
MIHMRYVIALGGNALAEPSSIDKVAKEVVREYLKGNKIVITHGNGPQVGELAEEQHRNLAVLTAETQAWIGTAIRERIDKELSRSKARADDIVEIVVTEAIVDRNSMAFSNPTKPIGRFYDAKEASIERRHGFVIKKMTGGYRRVVPSPVPKRIVQMDLIQRLLEDDRIVIACGGGGIPVTASRSGKLKYVNVVIDKDRASALLAKEIGASKFFILTNVDGVYLNYKKKGQELIGEITTGRLREHLKKGQFEEGSMKPKVESCIDFVESTRKIAVIGNISNPKGVISLRQSTMITPGS